MKKGRGGRGERGGGRGEGGGAYSLSLSPVDDPGAGGAT